MFRGGRSNTPPHRQSQNAPSTTPAGPPPDLSFIPSSTPGGPPPAMNNGLFGLSRPDFGRPNNDLGASFNFGSSPPKSPSRYGVLEGIGSGSIGTSTTGRPNTQRGRTVSSNSYSQGFAVPDTSSDNGMDAEGDSEEEDMDDDMDEDEDEDDYEDYDEDEDEDMQDAHHGRKPMAREPQFSTQRRAKTQNRFSQSVASRTSTSELETGPTLVHAGAKQTQFSLLDLAKGLAPIKDNATLHEPDNMILESELLLEKVQESFQSESPQTRAEALSDTAQDLVALWQGSSKSLKSNAASSNLTHATQLASLLLNIHHPPPLGHNQRSASLSLVPARSESRNYTAIPKVLLDWLNNTYPGVAEAEVVLKESRGYSRHPSYWEAVHVTAARGYFAQTVQLLQGAKFEFAETAQQDGSGHSGYTGQQLRAVNDVVRVAVDLLHECPAVASEDWDIKGHDWTIFRQRINQAYRNLQDYAEGESASRQSVSQPFQASHFGISQSQAAFQLSVTSRKAESRVPWSVYENLGRLYQLLLGNEEEILTLSADWIEGVLGLTIWWNGEEVEDIGQGSLAASRRSLMRSQRVRSVDVTPAKAYLERMSAALAAVLQNSDEEYGVSVTDKSEVGLAGIMDENVEAVLQILGSWSLTIASAVAELASVGGWLARNKGFMEQFNESDLLVLDNPILTQQSQGSRGISKDSLNVIYAQQLAAKGQLRSKDGQLAKEGWEVAIQVLGRSDDSMKANQRIEGILDNLALESASRVDKITQLCRGLGLEQYALNIAQKYADHLRTNTQSYGDTLLYYARAHDAKRIQEVLRVLVAHCLVKSVAYPPIDDLDDSLYSLIAAPKATLTQLARQDSEAAALLSTHLSGYATIRKFYDLRDEEVFLKGDEKPTQRALARRHAAANSLIVIISSAASSIRGGLYDPEVETVVQVDVLLPLLGEALVFLNQRKRTLTLSHLYSLLAAVEDLDTSPSMIRTQCEEVLGTTLLSAHDHNSSQNLPNSRSLLQKSTSNLTTASSQFSLIGSADFGSTDAQSTESSAVLVKGGHVDDVKRGWDWRRGFSKAAKGADLIRVLRLGIAREIGRAFAEGEVNA